MNRPRKTAATLDLALRKRLLDSLSGAERFVLFAPDLVRHFGVALEHAQSALRSIQTADTWVTGPFPASRVLVTAALSACGAVIAELPTGLRIPPHQHTGRELTLVLNGALTDESTRVYGPGDLIAMLPGSAHEIAVVGEHPCLAVFSSAIST